MEKISERRVSILLFGFPDKWHFGLDMCMWQMGSKFHGFRNVPAGVHYIYYSDPNDWHRQGFFYVPDDEDVSIWEWDTVSESFLRPKTLDAELMYRRRAMEDMSVISGILDYIMLFSIDDSGKWLELSCFVTPEVCHKIQPAGIGQTHSAPQASGTLNSEPAPTVFWTAIGPVRKSGGLTPSEVSELHMDKTAHLLQHISRSGYSTAADSILGELQAAYILFQLGQNYEAFLQYRRMLEIYCGCSEQGIKENMDMFEKFIRAVTAQVDEFPEDFLIDQSDNPVFVLALLARFVSECGELNKSQRADLKVDDLDKLVSKKFGSEWKISALPLDDDPVVVE